MKRLRFIFLALTFGFTHYGFAQTTAIPDANFEQALIDLGIDSNGLTGDILNSDAEAVTGLLNVSGKSISDLAGIEAFTEITTLYCYTNQLTNLDVSQNTKLLVLNCRSNQITSLDLSTNALLRDLNAQSNDLSSIDVTNNPNLTSLNLNSNSLTALDVTQNTDLKVLSLQSNQLTGLDISQNTELETIQLAVNQVTSLDVSQNVNLINLYCRNNQLTQIDVSQNLNLLRITINNNQLSQLDVSNNTLLTNLTCNNNNFTQLDLSNNSALERLYAYNNDLVLLDLKNGNNTTITDMDVTGNPSLSCIQVDDVAYSKDNWTDIDAGAFFSENCSVFVPDDNFEQALIDLGYDSGPLDDYVPLGNVISITSLDVSNLSIADMTGIEDFISLEVLSCQNNQISSIDVSQNTLLTQLNCANNSLIDLNVKNGNNINFTSFDATGNPGLVCIQVDDAIWSANNWTSIDGTSSFSADCSLFGITTHVPDDNFEQELINLGYDDILDDEVATANINSVTSLSLLNKNISDLTGIEDFTSLTTLICTNNNLSSLDVSNSPLLKTLFCTGNELSNLDLSNNTELTNLQCGSNNLTTLDVSQNVKLIGLSVDANLLTTLNVSNNPDLTTLACQNNALTTLDISSNPSITTLYCYSNSLIRLNVKNGNNTNFNFFNASNNPDLTCIEVDDATYSTTNWTDIDLQTSFSEDCQFDDDGDGVTNEQEALDGTDPQDGCLYLTANQTIENVSSDWNLQDCDCDGITNEDEIIAGDSPLPSPPSGSSDQVFCLRDNPIIADLVVAGEGIKWYDDFESTTPLDEQSLLTDGTSYFASQTVGSCYESSRLEVYVTLTNTEEPTGSITQSFCTNDEPAISDLVVTGSNILWYNSAEEDSPLATTTFLQSRKYYASQTVNDCESDRLEVEVILKDTERPTGEQRQTFCLTDDPKVTDIDVIGTDILWYTSETGETVIDSQSNLENGTYYASSSIDGCESNRLAVEVVVEGCNEVTGTDSNEHISFYPTVTDGEITIELNNPYTKVAVEVFSLQGKVVKTTQTISGSTIQLNIPGPSGIYVIEIQTSQQDRKLFRIIKK